MKVIKSTHRLNANIPPVNSSNYMDGRIGFWGLVKEQNSTNNTVTVISDTGFEFANIPVFSREWVTVDDNKNYIPSSRDLPPRNSWVFVLTPTFTANGAFVLCSGFTRGDENIRTLWAQNENEIEEKNNSRETKTQGGWDIKEEYANGNYSATSNDNNIKIVANPAKDTEKEQNKELSFTAWGNHIVIDETGIKITDKNNNDISATSDGLTITDSNENVIQTSSSGISITDLNNNTIVTSKNSSEECLVTINGHLTVKAGS